MSFISKPKINHKSVRRNGLGLTLRDYEGVSSTLCAGCGHDSVTAALVQSFWELDMPAQQVAKMSGIGCSSKTTGYFLSTAHGVNSVHGRMPSVTTGANAARRDLTYIGISGDGDSLSIGLGQFAHAIRRNLNMLYVIENNGVYGLTKGQFSASADLGSQTKKGEPNLQPPIDPVKAGLAMGASFIARGFSGDKAQLVPLIKAGLMHDGFALLDVISPCVTFNDHETSTKSYAYTREYYHPAIHADFIPPSNEILADYEQGASMDVVLHDGSSVRLRKVDQGYDPTNRGQAFNFLMDAQDRGEVVTGLLYIDPKGADMHKRSGTAQKPLGRMTHEELCPGSARLTDLQRAYR
jgi:2-oxoglutarate ferredoxin oxidoreductase subunit beta